MTDPVTIPQERRDELRKLADSATPGPWETEGPGWVHAPDYRTIVECSDGDHEDMGNAEFIAAARNVLPQLLDQLDAAEQRVRDLTQEVKDERGAALDLLDVIKDRDTRIANAVAILDEDTRWQNDTHILARIRTALTR